MLIFSKLKINLQIFKIVFIFEKVFCKPVMIKKKIMEADINQQDIFHILFLV